jgi:hypothetical protein
MTPKYPVAQGLHERAQLRVTGPTASQSAPDRDLALDARDTRRGLRQPQRDVEQSHGREL